MSVGCNVNPHHIKAKSADALERKMAAVATKRGTYIKFHSIQETRNGWWVAWFDNERKINLKKDFDNGISKE